jgi:dolichol kinase
MPHESTSSKQEVRRQLVHGFMVLPVLLLPWIPREVAIGLAALAVLQNLIVLPRLKLTRSLFRQNESRWGGIVLYPIAVLLLLLLSPESCYPWLPATAWVVLGIGDSAATLFGTKWGKIMLPGCSGKTLEGTGAFMLAAFCACTALLLAWEYSISQAIQMAAVAAFSGAFAEAIPLPWDDNLTVPAISALALGAWA